MHLVTVRFVQRNKMFVTSLISLIIVGLGHGVPLETGNFDRIVGGEDAPKGYSPHMVALIEGYFFKFLMCGGSIIQRNLILTAAHCIDPSILHGKLTDTFHARIGSNQWNSGGIIIEFRTFRNHPKWDFQTIKYDAGVIITNTDMPLSKEIRAVPLGKNWVGGEERAWVTGWGNTGPRMIGSGVYLSPTPDDLQLLYVETMTPERCSKEMKRVAAESWWGSAPDIVGRVEICTFHSVGHGMCNGDSGSALVIERDGVQVGLVSWGLPCAIGAPDVHTRITGIRDFLDVVMSERF